MLRRVFFVARKETFHIVRDMRTVYMALGMPLLLLLLFGYALTMDVEDIGLIVVDGDRSPASRDLEGGFTRSGIFSVVSRDDDPRGVLPAFRRNEARTALVIPRGFGRDIDRGDKGRAQLIADGTDANVASIAMGYAAAIGQARTMALASGSLGRLGLASGAKARPPVDVKARNWFNPTLKSQWYMVPGLIALIMAMMSAMLMALTVAREWERGTMEQLLATPVRPLEIVIGKLVPYFVIGVGQLALVASAGVLLFDVPIRGSVGLLLAVPCVVRVGAL
ncbi:MAG: ABC transporter permease, partial [Deltaproteobacteria bacterium]|nr:ABC transporter permease [Deltaproteobacteria bacterium]